MTRSIILGSRNKKYVEQQEIVANLAKNTFMRYGIPRVTESVACIFPQYFHLNRRYFSDNPTTFTRCTDNIEGVQMIVGGFSSKGLCVSHDSFGLENIGIAALVRL